MTHLLIFVESATEFKELIERCGRSGELLMAQFYGDWCTPCRNSAPFFDAIAQEYGPRGVVFAVINVDKCRAFCASEFINFLPTFKLYRGGRCVATIAGGNAGQLRAMLSRYILDPSVITMRACQDRPLLYAATRSVLKIMANVLMDPMQDEPRHVEMTSSDITDHIMKVPGCLECLYAVGFELRGGELFLPDEVDLGRMRNMIDQLRAGISPQLSRGMVRTELQNDTRLAACRNTVLNYLNQEAQDMARSLLPTERLVNLAADKAGVSIDEVTPNMFLPELLRWFKDEFFRWADEFKCETCGSKLRHTGSISPTEQEKEGDANNVELYRCPTDSTHPVFRFPRYNDLKTLMQTRCGRCGEWANCLTLFLVACRRPIPTGSTLTEGKAWFPACRFIVDWSDHVWCEIWLEDVTSPGTYRWVHCDAGGEIDQPLMYELGWGKRLSHIFGYTVPPSCFAAEDPETLKAVDVQDVTWRYTRNLTDVCARRDPSLEPYLVSYLTRIHMEATLLWGCKQTEISQICGEPNPFSLECIVRELATFLKLPKLPRSRLPGRKTGSYEWRKARGELGADDPRFDVPSGSEIPLYPTDQELQNGVFYLRYNSSLDIYQRLDCGIQSTSSQPSTSSGGTRERVKNARESGLWGWQNLATRWKNIARKVEPDWHMVYLARDEISDADRDGFIEWELDLRHTDYEIGKVSLFANMACHASDYMAQFIIYSPNPTRLCPPKSGARLSMYKTGNFVELKPGMRPVFRVPDFAGCKYLTLRGQLSTRPCLSENNDPCAWQKAQLFRQKDTDFDTWSLEWKVELVKTVQDEPMQQQD